ncbi:hypothetical protein [Pseudonocardia sp.]|uniref:hypothetical protein n=1 Tax=Pseudonocardia sp. TaxID=60912 RepID=UPI003D0F82DA
MNREQLADRCKELGYPSLTYGVIGSIETGRPAQKGGPRVREISLDEWSALARALDVPPPFLLSPVDDVKGEPDTVQAGLLALDSWELLLWLTGSGEAGEGLVSHPKSTDEMELIWLGRAIAEISGEILRTSVSLVDKFSRRPGFEFRIGGMVATRDAVDEYHRQGLIEVRKALQRIAHRGGRRPTLHEDVVRRAADLGVDLWADDDEDEQP